MLDGVLYLVFRKNKQLNNCLGKIRVALSRAFDGATYCRLICLFGLTLLDGLARMSCLFLLSGSWHW